MKKDAIKLFLVTEFADQMRGKGISNTLHAHPLEWEKIRTPTETPGIRTSTHQHQSYNENWIQGFKILPNHTKVNDWVWKLKLKYTVFPNLGEIASNKRQVYKPGQQETFFLFEDSIYLRGWCSQNYFDM